MDADVERAGMPHSESRKGDSQVGVPEKNPETCLSVPGRGPCL